MKKIVFALIISLFLFTFKIFAEDIFVPSNNTSVFVKYEAVWGFSEDRDLENPSKNAKGKSLMFGYKCVVTGNKKIKDKVYLQVQLPDKSKYWAKADYFALKLITITQNDVPVYNQPDETFKTRTKLPAGFLGYYVREQDGWINIDIISYFPKKPAEPVNWVGNVWIKSGYTDDVAVAKPASAFTSACYDLFGDKVNVKTALVTLTKGLQDTDSSTPPAVVASLKSIKEQYEAGVKATTIETKIGNFYKTNVTGLRIRESSNVDAKVLRNLEVGEKLKLVENGKEEVINGVKGNWGKYETEKGDAGWVFDAYLVDF
jgi:hypothetical protein